MSVQKIRQEQKTQLDEESIDKINTEEQVSGVDETENEEEILNFVGHQPEDLKDHGPQETQ